MLNREQFYTDIQKIPALKPKETIELFKQVERLAQEQSETKSKSKRQKLQKRIVALRHKIIEGNTRLIPYWIKSLNIPTHMEDQAICDGTYALTRACIKFKATEGYQFITYASKAIVNSMCAGRNTGAHTITKRRLQLVVQAKHALCEQRIEPTTDKIIEYLDKNGPPGWKGKWTKPYVDSTIGVEDFTATSVNEIHEFCKVSFNDSVERREDVQFVHNILAKLSDRDRFILKHRFGIAADQLTLTKVGQKLGLTRERIRQLEIEAKNKFSRLAAEFREEYREPHEQCNV